MTFEDFSGVTCSDAVFAVICREAACAREDVTLDTRLDALGIDSLNAITILYELEENLEIEVPNELVEKVVTVGDIVSGIDGIVSNDKK
jgi:acyl carrier protein